jgi:hypothetical protein
LGTADVEFKKVRSTDPLDGPFTGGTGPVFSMQGNLRMVERQGRNHGL